MFASRGWRYVLAACAVLLASSSIASAQENTSADTGTALTFSGVITEQMAGSDANACVLEDGNFNAQLGSSTSRSLLAFDLPSAAVGTYQLGQASDAKVTMLTLSDDPNELLVNWNASGGTFTITSLDAQVPVGDGSAATKGATGSIDADVVADKHGSVHISGSWACHMPF